jgi:hypothetical protein
MINIKPPELATCRRREARFAALYRSRATPLSPLSPVRTVLTCRGAPRGGMAAGTGQRRRAAGGVRRYSPRVGCQGKACSRSPHRDRSLPVTRGLTHRGGRDEMVPICVEISHRTWAEHHRRNRRDDEPRVFAGMTEQMRVSPGGRDISVDSLTTQLVINRCLPHSADTLGLSLRGRQHRSVYRLWSGCEMVCTDCGRGASDEESNGCA